MRLLFLTHNHPDLQPGGTEVFARALFRELRDAHGAEGLFLAGVTRALREPKPGTLLQAAGSAPDEMLVWLDHFDRFFLSQVDIYGLLAALAPLVARLQPDVIHLHHPLMFGLETVDLLRRLAPQAAMVATLHDYFAICPREGQLLTAELRLCHGPSLDRCRRCLIDRPAQDLALRDLALRGAFRAFDRLLAPSAFLRERFVTAGWDGARIEVMQNGIVTGAVAPHRSAATGRRDRFAVFGNVSRFKGTLVALQASARLSADGVAHGLAVHGGGAYQSEAFLAEFAAALSAAPDAVHHGPYGYTDHTALIAEADWVVVPSIWFENAPLVIQEAFHQRRPVICGGIGGMAGMVRDGTDGLHVPRVNDPRALAAAMRRAADEPGLWDALVAGIRPPRSIAEAARDHRALYARLRPATSARRPRHDNRKDAARG